MNEKAAPLLHEMPRFARRALSVGLAALLALSFTPRSLAYADSTQPGSDARIEAASDEGNGRAADSGGDADLLASYPMPTVRADATVRSSLVLLVKFKDDAWGDSDFSHTGFNAAYPYGGFRTYWEKFCASLDSVSGTPVQRSFRSYIRLMSDGQHDVQSFFPQTNESDGTVSCLSLDYEASHYVDNDEEMIAEALAKFNDAYADYDASALDVNADGYVDNLLIVPVVGRGGTFTSHEAVSYGQPSIGSVSPKKIGSYNVIEAYIDPTTGEVSTIFFEGTAAHEYLHTLDVRDYYRLGDGDADLGVPVGVWDVMANSGAFSWPLALTRQTAGWCSIAEEAPEGTYTLYAPADAGSEEGRAAGKRQAVKIKTPLSSSEYFVVEYRQKTSGVSNYDTKIGGSGFIVYRVNEKYVEEGNVTVRGDYVYVFREGETGMTNGRANGAGDIVHAQVSTPDRCEGGNRTEIGFTDVTKGLTDGAICYSDGRNSGLHIKPVEQTDGSITIEVSHADWSGTDFWQEVADPSGNVPFGTMGVPAVATATDGANVYVLAKSQMLGGDRTQHLGRVWKYDGSARSWGACGAEITGISNAQLAWFNGALYLAGADANARTVRLMRFDGASSWVDVASTPGTPTGASFPGLAVSGGGLYVLADDGGSNTRLYRLDGANLVQQGGNIPLGMAANSTVFDLNGSPAVVAGDIDAMPWETGIYRLAGSSWTKTATVGAGAAASISAVSVGDTVYLYTFESGSGTARLSSLADDGSVLSDWVVSNEVASALSLSGCLAADDAHLYLCGVDSEGSVAAYAAPVDDVSEFIQLGDMVYRSGSGLSVALVEGTLYCAVADGNGKTIAVRSHDALSAPKPPVDPPTDPPVDPPTDPPVDPPTVPDNPGETEQPVQKAEKELSGSTRIGTAIAVARETYPGGPKGVIVAKSNNFPDALAASTLAGAKGYPILLNPSDALDPDLRAYLRATKGTLGEIILIGDKNSLSRKVESDIRAIVPSVQRIGGVDRFDTARLLREAAKKAGAASDTAVVARSDSFPDALSVSPYCAATGAPLFIASPGSSLDKALLKELSGYKQVLIVGDTNSVSAKVEASLKSTSARVVRLAGGVGNSYPKTRYGTSAAIASWLVSSAGFSAERISFATGQNFPDALSGGPLCGSKRFPILLVDADDYSAIRVIPAGQAKGLYWLGSTNTLFAGLRTKIKKTMGY